METAQGEMRGAYVNGAPGVLVSGLVWLVAGFVWQRSGIPAAFTVLFFGGMLIFPLSVLIARAGFGAPKLAKGHPLDRLALESTVWLFAGILIAYAALRTAPEQVFAIMAITIGARYFVFRSLYGEVVYWVLGAVLAVVGGAALVHLVGFPVNVALLAGAIEVMFAAVLFFRFRAR